MRIKEDMDRLLETMTNPPSSDIKDPRDAELVERWEERLRGLEEELKSLERELSDLS